MEEHLRAWESLRGRSTYLRGNSALRRLLRPQTRLSVQANNLPVHHTLPHPRRERSHTRLSAQHQPAHTACLYTLVHGLESLAVDSAASDQHFLLLVTAQPASDHRGLVPPHSPPSVLVQTLQPGSSTHRTSVPDIAYRAQSTIAELTRLFGSFPGSSRA
eukprot:3441853-Rhodomonas_salina.1